MKNLKTIIKFVGIALVFAALVQELKKPPYERQWRGTVLGFIPYDFRMPTLENVLDAYWNPDEPRVFTDKVLGVGWAINFGRLYKLLSECCQEYGQSQTP